MKTSDLEVSLIDYCGSDLSVVNAARVSFDKESDWEYSVSKEYVDKKGVEWTEFDHKLSYRDSKLIHYLAKHKHLSPFNHAFITVRVKAPIFVTRQLVKHEYMPWNEVSRRYVDSEPEFYIPKIWRGKAENVKQGSSNRNIQICEDDGYNPVGHNTYCANEIYKDLLSKEVCPEQARMVLPLNTMTEWYWSGTLGAFAKMLSLRLDDHTQKETRDVAVLVLDIIKPLFPVSIEALLESYKEKNE